MNFLLKNRFLPSADLFFMIMGVVPDKVLTKVSAISLFHLASFLERRAVEIGDFKGFLSFYHRMLHTTRETNWIQLMIELAKTKKEFLGEALIMEYVSVKREGNLPTVRKIMHKVRMNIEANLKATPKAEGGETLSEAKS